MAISTSIFLLKSICMSLFIYLFAHFISLYAYLWVPLYNHNRTQICTNTPTYIHAPPTHTHTQLFASVVYECPWIYPLKSWSQPLEGKSQIMVMCKTGCCLCSKFPSPHHWCNLMEGQVPRKLGTSVSQKLPERSWSQQWIALRTPASGFSSWFASFVI